MAEDYSKYMPRPVAPVDPGLSLGLLNPFTWFQQQAAPLAAPPLSERKATPPPAPKWTPEAVMRAQEGLAKQFSDKPLAPMFGGSKLSGIMGGLANVANAGIPAWMTVQQMKAAEANERMRQDAVKNAMGATTPDQLVGALAGIPDFANFALQHKFSSVDPKSQTELRILQEKEKALQREAEEDAYFSSSAQGVPSSPAPGPAPSTPAPSPPPSAAAPVPSVPDITVAPQPSPQAQAPAVAPAATPQTLRELFLSKSPAEQQAFLMLRRKDKAKAAEMLAEWANPNKKMEEKRQLEFGEAQGKRDAENIPPSAATVNNISRGMNELASIPDRYGGDSGVFGSAVGPFQGDESGFWSNPLGPLARAWGSLSSAWATGPNNTAPPSEVRRAIEGATNTLASTLKPLIRKPGEGSWSDKDQAVLDSIVGRLATANTKEQYMRELENVRQRIKSNFNIDIAELGKAKAPAQSGGGNDPLGIR